jgi:imidazolonepropionase-like amidohydrolase
MAKRPVAIINASVIPGDGSTVIERATVLISGSTIVDILTTDHDPVAPEFSIIDAAGHTVIPGIINAHAHGCIHGPSMPSGSLPLGRSDVEYQRNRHLLSGTTTLLNVCGLALPDEITVCEPENHPLDIHVTTAHTPSNLAAALAVDGKGLRARHRGASVDDMIALGAKALGEAGGGQTLGGGAQDYQFIPAAIQAETGVSLHPRAARELKEAVLGRYLDGRGAADTAGLFILLQRHALDRHMSVERLVQIIRDAVLPPIALSLKGFAEIADEADRCGLPAIFHNATPTASTLIELAETHPTARFVAGHSNHPMFQPQEAVQVASELKKRGVAIDVSTLDCISTRWRNGPENLDALIEAGLVDTISTDFAGGDWNDILSAIHRIIIKRQMAPAAAVALATGNVARIFPEMAADRGLLARGKRADLAICESHDLSKVRHVICAGKAVVFNAAIASRRRASNAAGTIS